MDSLAGKAIIELIVVIVAIWAFIKFCSFSKRFTLPGKVKTWVYIITGLGCVFFNFLFSKAKTGMGMDTILIDPKLMTIAVVTSMIMVLIFSFALMSETKA